MILYHITSLYENRFSEKSMGQSSVSQFTKWPCWNGHVAGFYFCFGHNFGDTHVVSSPSRIVKNYVKYISWNNNLPVHIKHYKTNLTTYETNWTTYGAQPCSLQPSCSSCRKRDWKSVHCTRPWYRSEDIGNINRKPWVFPSTILRCLYR